MPSLPVSARTGPVPCRDPALCCRLHGPQLSKPRCQTPRAVSFLPGAGTGRGAACAGRTADTQGMHQVYSQLMEQGSIPSHRGWQDPKGWRGCKGGQGVLGVPPARSAQGSPVQQEGLRWVAFSWPHPSVPTMSPAPCAFPVRIPHNQPLALKVPLSSSTWGGLSGARGARQGPP